jgi:hypothetical protein
MARNDAAKLLAKAQKIVSSLGTIPSQRELARKLKCRLTTAAEIQKQLGGSPENFCRPDSVTLPPPVSIPDATGDSSTPTERPTLTETDDISGDKRTITLPRTRVQTVDELLAHCKVDVNIWEVERFVVNKWEMGYIAKVDKTERVYKEKQADKIAGEPASDTGSISGLAGADTAGPLHKNSKTTYNRESGYQELFQVKAFLRKKVCENLDGYVVDNARLRASLSRVRLELGREKAYSRRLAQNHCGYDDFLAGLDAFMQKIGNHTLPIERVKVADPQIVLPSAAVRDGHTEDVVMQWSDTHFGDRIRREDTSGFPEYDVTIAGNRWGYVISKAKQVLTLHRTMYPLKRLYIWFGGDIGNGSLHDSPNSNELFDFAQCHFSFHMFKFGLEDLLSLTEPDAQGNVVVEEIVLLFTVGNHMRVDEKMPHKYQAQRTGDWMIYQMIIDHFKSNPKISIRQQMSPFIFENIRGHRHLFAHGMQVGYKNSPDAQNKSIGSFIQHARALFDSPEWRRKNGLMGETFSRACIGDIHVPITFPRFKSNGSLNGQNELGVNWTLEPIPAGQQIWGVADKHQETWQYFLECSHIQKAPGDFNKYGTYAQEYTAQWGR